MFKGIDIRFPKEVRELSMDMGLFEIISRLGINNICEGLKLLKVKYGLTYDKMARVMGLAPATVRGMIKLGTYEGYVSEQRLASAIEDLQIYYIEDTFAEYRRKEKR